MQNLDRKGSPSWVPKSRPLQACSPVMVDWVMSLSVELESTLNLILLTTCINVRSEGVKKKGLEEMFRTH